MDEYTRKNPKYWYYFRSTVYRAACNILTLTEDDKNGDTPRISPDDFHRAFLPVRTPSSSGQDGWWQNCCRVGFYHPLSPTSNSNIEETKAANDEAYMAIYFLKESADVRGGQGRWVCQPGTAMGDTDLYQMLSVYLILTESQLEALPLAEVISHEDLGAVLTTYEAYPERVGLADKEGPAFLRALIAILKENGQAGDGNESAMPGEEPGEESGDANLLAEAKRLLVAKSGITDLFSALKT